MENEDLGVISALMERFENYRLPRAMRLHEEVMAGKKLTEYDMMFLEEILTSANELTPLLDRHPEYQELATKALSLYKEITEKALENEK